MMADSEGPLIEFFRGDGAAMGRDGDHEGWSAEQTAVHFLRKHLSCGTPPPDPDWSAIMDHITFTVRHELLTNLKVGAALSLSEGEKLIGQLSQRLAYDIHKRVDPTYDTDPGEMP